MSVSEAVNAPMVHQSLVRAEASHPYAVEALETLDALDAIADEWRELEERATGRQIFQTFSWCRHWAAQALGAKPGSRARMRIVTVRAKGRLVLIWPVAIHRCRSVRKTSWLGEPNSQYGDILAEPGAELAGWALQAWNLMKSWSDVDVLHFARVRADALVAPFLSSQAPSLPNVDSALAVDRA
jgi:CelD/BcsL family acetyltransferase involved in cellulose biosynthesis